MLRTVPTLLLDWLLLNVTKQTRPSVFFKPSCVTSQLSAQEPRWAPLRSQLGSHYTSAVLSSLLGLLWEEFTLQFIQADNRIQFPMIVKLKATICLLVASQGHLLNGKGHPRSPHFSRKNLPSLTEPLYESPTNWQTLSVLKGSVAQILQSPTLISSTAYDQLLQNFTNIYKVTLKQHQYYLYYTEQSRTNKLTVFPYNSVIHNPVSFL